VAKAACFTCRVIKERAAAVGVAALAALTACTGSSGTPAASPPSTASPTTSATTGAAQDLQRLAGLAAGLTYAATYRAHLRSPASTATWRVWRGRTSLRVDVVARRVIATLIVTAHGSYSCRKAKRARTCFRVAKAGAPIPAPFDYAPHTLFSTTVDQLARNAGAYVVTAARARPADGQVPASTCFAVRPVASTPKPQALAATYCFSMRGLLTAVTYPSHDTVRLVDAALRTPPTSRFVPYASPTPIPG
jgi:hypothetical protein